MSFLNTNDVDVNVNIDEVLQDGTVTKEKLAEDVQNKIYEPNVVTSKGADLAEVGFWVDNNPENEDRLYRFISIAGETGREIKIADSNDQIAGTSNIIDNVGFLGGYTDGDENDNTKVIVSIVGVVPVKTNDNTIKANDRVMSDNNGYAVKSTNNCGYRVLEVIEEGLLNIVVSPNTDMVQRIKTDMDGKQPNLTAGAGISINEDNVISANVVTDYNDLTNQPIKNLALSMTKYTMLTDIADGCYIVAEEGLIKTTSGRLLNFSVGTELMIATYNGVKSGTYQTGKAVASFNDNMTASEKSFTWLNTSHKDLQITENATDVTIPTSKAVKDYVDELFNSIINGNEVSY